MLRPGPETERSSFHISCSLASKIFTAWIKALAVVLSHMIRIPDSETVIVTKPSRYCSRNLASLMVIVDCTKLFIANNSRPCNPGCNLELLQAPQYITLKVLTAVSLNSYICYVSPVYEGRISDTELTKDCGLIKSMQLTLCQKFLPKSGQFSEMTHPKRITLEENL